MKVLIADRERYCREFLQDLVEQNQDTQVPGIAVDADGYGHWKQSVEKLKEKWTAFMRGIIRAIAEEEMKISREEFHKQIGTHTR